MYDLTRQILFADMKAPLCICRLPAAFLNLFCVASPRLLFVWLLCRGSLLGRLVGWHSKSGSLQVAPRKARHQGATLGRIEHSRLLVSVWLQSLISAIYFPKRTPRAAQRSFATPALSIATCLLAMKLVASSQRVALQGHKLIAQGRIVNGLGSLHRKSN